MSKFRLINCEFVNAGSFRVNVSNKAKLLYLIMLVSADDRGFVDTTNDIINALTTNEDEFNKVHSLELIGNTYQSALQELIDKGYIYEFVDNHNNKVHLLRHWFFHNKLIKGLWTNYKNFVKKVSLENNEYVLNREPLKESNIKELNVNNENINNEEIDLKSAMEYLNELEKKEKEE